MTFFRLGGRTGKARESVSAHDLIKGRQAPMTRRNTPWAALETEDFILPDVRDFRRLCIDFSKDASFILFKGI